MECQQCYWHESHVRRDTL